MCIFCKESLPFLGTSTLCDRGLGTWQAVPALVVVETQLPHA